MASVTRGLRRPRSRGFGAFGDASSDFFLSTPQGSAALASAQSAASKLPAGFTMGDPTGPEWGASYYTGKKVIYAAIGQPVQLEDSTYGPVYDSTLATLIDNAANAAYGVYNGILTLRQASPQMYAILTDPAWYGAPSHVWSQLPAELQAKIKLVPFLYESLTSPEQAQADADAANAAQAAARTTAAQTAAATGPRLVDGIEFYPTGQVVSVNGLAVTGKTLTAEQTQRLLSGGTLTAAERAALLPPPKPAAPPVVAPPTNVIPQTSQTLPVATGSPGTDFAAANAGAAGATVFPVTPSQATGLSAEGESLLSQPLVLAGLAVVAAFLFMRKR